MPRTPRPVPDTYRVMSRDRERFEALWEAHFEAVLGYARRRADHDAADEATSHTFLTAWRRLDDIPQDAELPWLLGTCRRTLANERRGERRGVALRRRIEALPPAAVPDPRDHIGESQAVREAFRSLTPGDRETLALIAWDGLTPAEAAGVTGCSPARFRARLFRARRRLRHALDAAGAALPVPTATDAPANAQEDTR